MAENSTEVIDFSNGSKNPYLLESRHNLIPPCYGCGKFIPILLDGNDYYAYFMGDRRRYIQDIFTYLSASQRELLITGWHPGCYDKFFGEEEG